jgi:hypothetical protein
MKKPIRTWHCQVGLKKSNDRKMEDRNMQSGITEGMLIVEQQ